MMETKIYTPCLLVLLSARLDVAQITTTAKPKENHGFFDCGEQKENTEITGSKYNMSKLKHSDIDYSTVWCSMVIASTIDDSTVTNSELIDVKVLEKSNITRSTLEDTKVTNSTIVNSNIHISDIRFSIIKDYHERIIDCCYKYCILEGDTPARNMEGEVKLYVEKYTPFTILFSSMDFMIHE